MQLAVVELSRSLLGFSDANTTEVNPKTKHPVVDILPEQQKHLKIDNYGGTMRLGAYTAVIKKGTQAFAAYKKETISERHRHRYEVNPEYIKMLEEKNVVFSGSSPDGRLMEIIELPKKYILSLLGHSSILSLSQDHYHHIHCLRPLSRRQL